MNFIEEVEEGQKGRYSGLKTGHKRLDKFINGLQKKHYYLIGGSPKSGKTAFLDEFAVLGPYLNNPSANVRWIYYSFEVDKLEKMAKYTAYFMDKKYGIYCDSNYILSRGENKLSDEHKELIRDIYNNELKDLFSKIDFIEDRTHPEGIRRYLLEYAKQNGEFQEEPYYIDGVKHNRLVGYKENDPTLHTIAIIDHAALLPKERGLDLKGNIDLLSKHLVWLRNMCSFTPVLVQQFNRDMGKTDRLKFSGEQLAPTLEDFRDSADPAQDASMVIGLFNPSVYSHLERHLGYNLRKIGSSYRSLHILASRNTESNVNLSLILEGKTGKFKELPKADDIENLENVYTYVEKFK